MVSFVSRTVLTEYWYQSVILVHHKARIVVNSILCISPVCQLFASHCNLQSIVHLPYTARARQDDFYSTSHG